MNRAPQILAAAGGGASQPSPAETATGPLRHLWGLVAEVSVPQIVRRALFLAAFLTAWITLRPFPSLSGAENGDIVSGKDGLTYGLFGAFAVLAFAFAFVEHRRALVSLLTPLTITLVAWIGLSGVIGQDPATSGKRFALTVAVLVLTACLPLLPGSRRELRNLLALAALVMLGVCYLGVFVAPDLAIHQRTDFVEPALVGAWRGSFGHKNAAAAVMAMLIFIGIAVFRSGLRSVGAAITILAAGFIVGSEGKSAAALAIAVIAITASFAVVRSLTGRALLTLGPVLLFNALSVGTLLNGGLAAIAAALPIDTTFTGRSDVWKFALESVVARPIVGYGYAAFWNTEDVRDSAVDETTWAGTAAHSHNSYLDTMLTLGAIGLVLTLIVLVVGPLRDYHRARAEGTDAAPFATLFLQFWLFGVLLSSMESFFYDRAEAIWFSFVFAVCGLRYLARFRTQ